MTGAIHRIIASRGRSAAAGLIAVFAAIATAVVPATAANADTSPYPTIAHVCKDIGHDSGGVHGILCSDLVYERYNGGTEYADVTEAYCQNASGYVPCPDINIWQSLDWPGQGVYIVGGGCGPASFYYVNQSCAAGRNYYLDGWKDVPSGTCLEMWGVTWGDAFSGQSDIQLPRGMVKLVGNFETGHHTVCG
jgi:hypothetical protein